MRRLFLLLALTPTPFSHAAEPHFLPLQNPAFSAVGRIYSPKGDCTGFLISSRTVVTAAHCIAKLVNEGRGPSDYIVFVPFLESFPKAEAQQHGIYVENVITPGMPRKVPLFWKSNGDLDENAPATASENDIALLILPIDVIFLTPFPLFQGSLGEVKDSGQNLTIAGFPARPSHAYYQAGFVPPTFGLLNACHIESFASPKAELNCEVDHGNSGGPALVNVNGEWQALGVVSSSGEGHTTVIELRAHAEWIRANMR